MKKCIIESCSTSQFGGGYCKYHQYIRRLKGGDLYKQKPRQKSEIPKESKKRKKENKTYLDQIKEFWEESVDNGTNFCFFCGKVMDKRDNIHHLKGRTNNYLLDKRWWVNAHNECHVWKYTYLDVAKLMQEPWYDDFLKRLAEKDNILYRNELLKQRKAQLNLEIE